MILKDRRKGGEVPTNPTRRLDAQPSDKSYKKEGEKTPVIEKSQNPSGTLH
jgi:hypothetical protein